MPYIVRVYDNFHYMDEGEAFDLPALASAEEALARCKAIVDRSLQELRCEGMSADALYTRYQMFGDDPVVIASGGAPDRPPARRSRRRSPTTCSIEAAARARWRASFGCDQTPPSDADRRHAFH